MSETTTESTTGQEHTAEQIDAEIRAKLIADWVPEEEITSELIAERIEIDGRLDDTAMISGETIDAWRRRLLEAAEERDAWSIASTALDQAQQVALEAANEARDGVTWAVQDAVWSIPDRIGDAAADKVDGFLQWFFSKIPGMENFSLWDTVKTAVMWFFALLWLDKLFPNIFWKWEENQEQEPNDTQIETAQEDPSETTWSQDTPPPTVEGEDEITEWDELVNLDTKRASLFISGSKLILSLNGRSEYPNANPDDIRNAIKIMSYDEILSLNVDQVNLLWDEVSDDEDKLRDEILEKLRSEDTQTLLRVWLSESSIWNIINPNWEFNTRLAQYFGESEEAGEVRLKAILELSETGNRDWWKALSYEEISMLYIQSIPALRIPTINGLWDIVWEVQWFFGEVTIPNELDELSAIPRSVLERFASKPADTLTNALIGAGSSQNIIDSLYEWEEPVPEEREVIERIFKMQQYLMWWFVDETKLGLSDEQKELFQQNLDYAGVLSIYAILWWVDNIENINPLSLPILIWTISKIIWSGNIQSSYQANIYIWNYTSEALSGSWDLWLSDEELEVLWIYGSRVIDMMVYSHIDGIARTMGIPAWALDLNLTELWLWMFWWGFVANRMWTRLISRWIDRNRISIWWGLLRKAWLIGMFAWAITGWAGFFLEENPMVAFASDLDEALNANDGQGDLARVQEILELHENSVREIALENWETMVISAYPWETPFVIIAWNIYVLNIWPKNFLDAFQDNIDDPSWAWFWSLVSRQIPFSQDTWVIDSINYNLQSYEAISESIIFWEWDNTFTMSLDEIFTIQWWEEQTIWADLLYTLTEWEKQFSEAATWYIVWEVGNNNLLYLHKVWSLSSQNS